MCVPRNLCSISRSLLIGVSVILPLLIGNVVTKVTATTTSTATGTAAATNYRKSRSYEDAATAAAVTAAMTAAALPAAATAKDYSQQLPRYYQPPSAVVATVPHDVGGASSIYRNYFENSDIGSDKIGGRTRDEMTQWRMPTGSERTAIATNEQTMTAAGFVPTTMTAAGQHYVASMATAAATIGVAHAADDFQDSASAAGGKAERETSAGDDGYAYATPTGKIDYEINEDNYESGDRDARDDIGGGDGGRAASLDAYAMYKYDMGEYAEHMQRALANSATGMEGQYDVTSDVDSSNQGGGKYFEKRLPDYENYYMPTYQIEQFSNYHNQQEQQQQQQQHEQQEHEQQDQQEPAQQKLNEQRRQQPHLRPLALFDSSDDGDDGNDDGNSAILQQFNKGTNIENYANDKQKLRYYAKQPQLQQEQQLQEQHQHQQQQQQQQIQEQYEHEQHQQLQLTQKLHKFPDFTHFPLHQHLPRPQQRAVRVPAKATRPSDKTPPLSARRRQQQQLQHQRRDGALLPSSLQVIGNAARLSLLSTTENLHVDSDISSRGKSSNNNVNIHSRARNDKRSISEKVADITNAPSQYHYALTHAHAHPHAQLPSAHVSQLVDDSVNEIDDTHNNIDDNGISETSRNEGSNRRDHHHHHQDFTSLSSHHHQQQQQQTTPYQQHGDSLVQQYTLPPITTTVRHTPASTAALAGIPLARHVQVTKHIPTITDYERIHVPYNQSVPIRIPHPVVSTIRRPYAIRVPVAKNVVVPKIQEVRIPVEKVKPFPVERPVPFVVERRVPYMVEKQVAKPIYYPYPVQVPIVKTIVHKVPRRHHSYATYQPHANSYPLSLGQYHLQQQHSTGHTLPALHFTQMGHFG